MANHEIYHVFNRSIARAEIFSQMGNLHKIFEIVDYYRFHQTVRLSNEQFMHVSRYIHLNPVTSYLIEFDKLKSFEWTLFSAYAADEEISFINTKFLLDMFGSKEDYVKFVADQVDYQRRLASIKDLILE